MYEHMCRAITTLLRYKVGRQQYHITHNKHYKGNMQLDSILSSFTDVKITCNKMTVTRLTEELKCCLRIDKI